MTISPLDWKSCPYSDEEWEQRLHDFQANSDPSTLVMWVVYKHPRDMPTKWVVRRWEVAQGEQRMGTAYGYKSVEDARSAVPPWASRLERNPGDDPAIYEVWL